MNAVEALAVMRIVSAAVLQGEARSSMREDMDKARAAVAELITERARLAYIVSSYEATIARLVAQQDSMADTLVTLARVGGDS